MVGDVDPITHVAPVAVHRQLLPLERVRDHQWDQLLGKLVGTVVVRAPRDQRREPVRVECRTHQQVTPRLARRVGRVRLQRRLLGEATRGPEAAVDLVGADMDEALDPRATRGVDEHLRADHVGAHERGGVHHRPVDVTLGSEVHDGVRPVLLERPLHVLLFDDIAANEGVVRVRLDFGQVLEVAGVGQRVEVDDLVLRLAEQHPHEVRADEPCTTGDEDPAHTCSSAR